ncbi:LysM peptidoglycan-binding domain-containing protein [Curvivirga aplysinae]|uniref:LysM peptidoglycan-binding domain-containing protein n=1 Tax=Curvivirga aplysinae TaxID=2529852 RepID=UPI0012BD3479|nr:LysM peptidoglycan-binding domain-containing protein [Curvivirga aplysinae]MTI10013.1 LysM peptidoglycan-binding domain-containing protein [Curvivirga aplysinae]
MSRTIIIGIAGVVLILAALSLNIWFNAEVPDDTAVVEEQSVDVPENKVTEEISKSTNLNPGEIPALDFDVVRISKEGDTVIAGRAPAGATVIIMDGDTELGRVIADEAGEWVFLPEKPLESGSRELSLRAEMNDGTTTESSNMVILSVPERGVETEKPLAVLVPKDGGTSKILQKPVEEGGVAAKAGGLILDSIDYDESGNVTIAGRGVAGAQIRAYLDNEVLANTDVAENTSWSLQPEKQIDPGIYALRLDQLIGNKVVSRLEIPFNRAEPITDLSAGNFIIVQPGNSLWRIARRTLGNGFSYTEIYEANAEQIRDPDLIYPGQVFQIPSSGN